MAFLFQHGFHGEVFMGSRKEQILFHDNAGGFVNRAAVCTADYPEIHT